MCNLSGWAQLPTALTLWLAVSVASGTDTAFWKPYQPDAATYQLAHLDSNKPADLAGFAQPERAELLGDAAFDAAGKFAGALRLRGHGAARLGASAIFPGGHVSIEAWVRLQRYPEKLAYIVYRPAAVDTSPQYDPAVDVTKGLSLAVDSHGALHLETTNCFYGKSTRTSSAAGAVPWDEWVHLAAVSVQSPIASRRLYVNGREVQAQPVEWGQGLTVGADEERKPAAVYLGNSDRDDAGLCGWIDEVRIHTKIARFWERDDAWPARTPAAAVPSGPPHFLAEHSPLVYLPLDGDTGDAAGRMDELKVQAEGSHFVPGVRGQAWLGPLRLSAPRLLDLREGSFEFWLQPVGVHNLADNNRNFAAGPFILYFLNDGGGLGLKPFTLYFGTPGGTHFLHDSLDTEFHPGAWYHVVTTWKGKTITLYLNGRQAGQTLDRGLATADNKGVGSTLQLSPHEPIGIIDEVRVYGQALLPEEAANGFFRYRDPARLLSDVRTKALDLRAGVLPSTDTIYYQATPNRPIPADARLRLTLSDEAGRELLRRDVPFSSAEQNLQTPTLPEGVLTLTASVLRPDGTLDRGDTFRFVRKRFPWEANRLGVTEEVFPPFEPVRTRGAEVSVVGRTLAMNGFGLWNRVVSLGRDLLDAPLRLRFLTAEGEGQWTRAAGRWVSAKPDAAVFAAEATADAIQVKTVSTVELDGCMKVHMELAPGAKPAEVRDLWVEIPLRAAEVPLMHTIGDGLRHNYAGRTPEGSGVVWDGSRAARTGPWRNSFTPYIWLGGEERGLAWFGENDKGWITEKHKSKTPTHELVRSARSAGSDGAVVLKIHLINRPVTLGQPARLVFGLQASPTKPLPADWRKRLPDMPTGLAVVPFGGLQCASQGPFRDDWQVADKILDCRAGRPLDEAWLGEYVRKNQPPLVHGTWGWASSVGHFAGRARGVGPNRPLTVYQEEMMAATTRPEFAVFQDEWNSSPEGSARVCLDPSILARGHSTVGKSVEVTFSPSYRDFGCWFADQWLRRGVSLYWDNTYPHLSLNPRVSDAYLAEDGEIQPCLILWNQREYHKRVWQLLQQWRRVRPEPLEWVLHMTNTLVLPIHTWGTADLDHELASDQPFSPEWLRTETTGRQVGNLPLSLYAVAGSKNKVFAKLRESRPKEQLDRLEERVEWAMRTVHEIQHGGPLEKFLTDFGYGRDSVAVHNYWARQPLLSVQPESVKWLAVADPAKKRLLVVLACWSADRVDARITVDEQQLGFPLGGSSCVDVETGERLAPSLPITLPAPYGVRLLWFKP